MLIQFSVENFKSFKTETVLSFAASKDTDHSNNYFTASDNKNYLKVITINGANAAGKSNLFSALASALRILSDSNNRQEGQPIPWIIPFKFDKKTINEPTSFEFVFLADNGKERTGTKYIYGFSATTKRVYSEYLYKYNSAKPTTIFEMEIANDVPKYTFTNPEIRRHLEPITKRNTGNKLFLATATNWNCEETREPLLWLTKKIGVYSSDINMLLDMAGPLYENDTSGELKAFTQKILHEADLSIDGFKFDTKDIPHDQFLLQFPPEIRGIVSSTSNTNHKEYNVNTKHIVNNNGEKEEYEINLFEESEGTKNVFLISPIIKRALDTGEAVFIDEFDRSLHPMLLEYLIGLFNNPETNKLNAQFTITTQTTEILSLDISRRDQIYFIEKDRETGVSELFSLDEFSARKDENIRKSYLLGKFGAVPNIKEGYLA